MGWTPKTSEPRRRAHARIVARCPDQWNSNEAVADQGRDKVGVARCERVVDGALDGVVRLVPRGSSPVEDRHLLRLADREFTLKEVAQEGVVAV